MASRLDCRAPARRHGILRTILHGGPCTAPVEYHGDAQVEKPMTITTTCRETVSRRPPHGLMMVLTVLFALFIPDGTNDR